MAPVSGSRGVKDITATQVPLDVADFLLNIESGLKNDDSSLFVLTASMDKKVEAHAPQFDQFEDTYNLRTFAVAAAGAAKNATTVPLAAGQGGWCAAGTQLYNPATGERLLVTSVSTDDLTVVRNVGGAITGTDGSAEGQGIALVSADVLLYAGDARTEGGAAPAMISTATQKSYNYTQVFSHLASVTKTLQNTKLYAEPSGDLDYQTKKKMIEHKMAINRAFWFGSRSTRTDADGFTKRTTGGVIQHVKGNIFDISGAAYGGGTLTHKVLDEWIEKLFMNTGSGVRHVFHGMKFGHALDNILKNYTQVDGKSESFGTIMKEYKSSSGVLRFVCEKKIFDADTNLAGTAIALDMDFLKYVHLANCDTLLYKDVATRKEFRGTQNLVETECGLMFRGHGLDNTNAAVTDEFRSVHGKLTGFTGY